jgi:uncharacterized protein YktA (UPF0223 family)
MQLEEFNDWCRRHGIQIIDKDKRAHRWTKQNVKYFQNPTDYNIVYEDITLETEPLYTVEITLSELERLAEFEQQVFNNLKQTGHYNMFEKIMKQKHQEKDLRTKYAAVQKAYEHYSLLLKLAESGELKGK